MTLSQSSLIFLGCLSLAYSHQYQTTLFYEIPQKQCTVYYTATPTSIQLLNCTSPYFVGFFWNNCKAYCCESESLSSTSFSLAALQQCSTDSQDESYESAKIATAIVSSLILLCICLYCTAKICKRVQRPSNEVQVADKPISRVQWEDQTQINNIEYNIQWSSRANRSNILKFTDEPCSICLENYTTAELFCRHQYHPKCIGQWLRKSDCCPCCRRDHIQGIKIFCEICRWRYFICSRMLVVKNRLNLPSRCSVCSQHRLSQESNSLAELIPQASRQKMIKESDSPLRTSENNQIRNMLQVSQSRIQVPPSEVSNF